MEATYCSPKTVNNRQEVQMLWFPCQPQNAYICTVRTTTASSLWQYAFKSTKLCKINS